MMAHDIIVSLCIFSLLKYNRIFGKNLEHDTFGYNKVLDPGFCGASVPGLAPAIYLFLWHTEVHMTYLKL